MRRWDLLWLVRAWAARWCALERRKQARAAAYQAAMERPDLPEPERAALEACLHALVEADSQEVRTLTPKSHLVQLHPGSQSWHGGLPARAAGGRLAGGAPKTLIPISIAMRPRQPGLAWRPHALRACAGGV